MSSTKRPRKHSLAIRLLGGADAAVVVAGAAAALDAAAAGVVAVVVVAEAAAAVGGDVAAGEWAATQTSNKPRPRLGDRGFFASCVTPNWEDDVNAPPVLGGSQSTVGGTDKSIAISE
jgi:hypothetical protein